MKFFIIHLFFILYSYCLNAQITFEKKITFNSPTVPSPEGHFVIQTTDSGFFVGGSTAENSSIQMASAIGLVKTDKQGNILWQKVYGNVSAGDYLCAHSGALTKDNGYILAGCIDCYTNLPDPKSKYLLMKLDSLGDTLWTRTYERDKRCWAQWVEPTTDGGYIMAGYGAATIGSADVWVVKTDSLGIQLWDKAYQLNGEDRGWCIRQTADGGYIVIGSSTIPGWSNADIWLLKLSGIGNIIWTKFFSKGTWSYWGARPYEIQQTKDGGFIFTGYIDTTAATLTKIDSFGNLQWTKRYNDADGYSIQQTSDGGYIVTGSSSYRIYLLKTDINGDSIWISLFGDTLDYAKGLFVRQCYDGGYVITGLSLFFGMYLIKTATNGKVTWVKEISLTPKSELWIYPNPVNDRATIGFRLPEKGKVCVNIFDISGKKIMTIFEEIAEQKKNYEIKFKTHELNNGLYFVELNYGSNRDVKKLVVIK